MNNLDFEKLEKEFNSPDKLHELALHYNWDVGIDLPQWIIRNPICDKGTALLIYWRAGAGFFCQYKDRQDVSPYQLALYDLVREVEQEYIGGFYKNQWILFNPRFDTTIQSDGYDHTQTYDNFPQKSTIPDELKESSIPDIEWEKLDKPIKPAERINYEEWFRPVDDDLEGLEKGDTTNRIPD